MCSCIVIKLTKECNSALVIMYLSAVCDSQGREKYWVPIYSRPLLSHYGANAILFYQLEIAPGVHSVLDKIEWLI